MNAGDTATVSWRMTGTLYGQSLDVDFTSILEMNLISGRIIKHQYVHFIINFVECFLEILGTWKDALHWLLLRSFLVESHGPFNSSRKTDKSNLRS